MSGRDSIDWLAERVVEVLSARHDPAYAEDVRDRLAGRDRFRVLLWLNELDGQDLAALAHRLGIDAPRLKVAADVARYL